MESEINSSFMKSEINSSFMENSSFLKRNKERRKMKSDRETL